MEEKIIVNEETMGRTIARLAHEIIEQNPAEEEICLIGIKRRGVPLARRLQNNIERFSGIRVLTGELDITLYRDDLSERFPEPHLNSSVIAFDVRNKRIVLVDDVLYTGRTTRAAMDAVIALGRPKKIELAVLVDRGHRELPISANYVGKNIPTSRKEFVAVRLIETDGKDEVALFTKEPG